jgi:hypothetical protein
MMVAVPFLRRLLQVAGGKKWCLWVAVDRSQQQLGDRSGTGIEMGKTPMT